MPRSLLIAQLLTVAMVVQVACAQPKPRDLQIAEAVTPLPAELRDGALVKGYAGSTDRLSILREGTNEMICLADKPGDETFHVACYHRSLEPFMARGRRLRAEGKERDEVQGIRGAEIEDGSLAFPNHPAALYSLSGGSYNAETGEMEGADGLDVIYLPYATAESTGLPTAPSSGPWLMFPGLPWAHVMISR